LLGTFLIAWVSADDAATNRAIFLDAKNAAGWQTYGTLLAAMLAGTAAVIAAAFVSDRFGLGHGFWIVIAVQFGVVIWAAVTADWPMARRLFSCASQSSWRSCSMPAGSWWCLR
jgi:hypothetical protein